MKSLILIIIIVVVGFVMYTYKDLYKKYFSFLNTDDSNMVGNVICDGDKCMLVKPNKQNDSPNDIESSSSDSTYETQSFTIGNQSINSISLESASLSGGSFLSQGSEIDNMSYGSSIGFDSENMSEIQSSFFED